MGLLYGSYKEAQFLGWLIASQLLALAVGLWLGAQVEAILISTTGRPPESVATAAGQPEVASSTLVPTLISFGWIASLQLFALWLYESRIRSNRRQAAQLVESEYARLNADVVRLRDAIVFGLAKLAESRDTDTGHHLERIAAYSTRLARVMRQNLELQSQITGQFVQDIGVSSALHDIGKVAVEDAILLKPGPLTADERRRMQKHPVVGAQCIEQIGRRLGDANFLQLAHEIALHHHERWDGTGYPHQLAGTDIPLSARIVALADVYDALSARRVYKAAIPHQECVETIRREAGKQFDPQVVDAFLLIAADFQQIRERYIEVLPDDHEPRIPSASRCREHAEALLTPDLEQVLLSVVGATPKALSEVHDFQRVASTH